MKEDTKFPPIGTKLRFLKRGYRWTTADAGDEVVVVHHAKECFHTTTSRGPSDVWIFPLTWEDGLEIVDSQPPARQEGETHGLDEIIVEMINHFLRWPLPHSVRVDGCALIQGEGRTGTNLLSAAETTDMISQVVRPKIDDMLRKLSAKQAEVDQMAREHGHEFAKHREEMSALQRELETLKAAQGWREIETAPTDGTVFLAFVPHSQVGFMFACTRSTRDAWVCMMSGDAQNPTHWMPLPTPPVERSVDGE